MAKLRIYTNESVDVAVAVGLRQRGVDAWSARESNNLGLSDVEQLEFAARERAVIFTHDADFLRIARDWRLKGKPHWGVIYAHEQKYSVGTCIRRLANFALMLQAEDMVNRVEFL